MMTELRYATQPIDGKPILDFVGAYVRPGGDFSEEVQARDVRAVLFPNNSQALVIIGLQFKVPMAEALQLANEIEDAMNEHRLKTPTIETTAPQEHEVPSKRERDDLGISDDHPKFI